MWPAIELAAGILSDGLDATANAHQKVDQHVDRLAHPAHLEALAVCGGGKIGAPTGYGDDAQSGAMGHLPLPFHEGLQKQSKVRAKLRVVFERLGQYEEIERSAERHMIDAKNMLDLFDVAIATVEEA